MQQAFSSKMPRDYRIDFFRGLALISIFVNHIPGNFYANFTHRNFGLSDAAEIFVLLAGMSAALAYYPRFVAGKTALSIARVVRRIGTLYIAHLSAVAIGFALYAAAAIWLNNPGLMVPDERHWILDQTLASLAGIGALTYQTGNFNILPMYMVMLAFLPVIMLLARVHLLLALGASAALWLVANIYHLGPPNYPGTGVWYFNPLAWQLLFTIGFVCGVALRRGEVWRRSTPLYVACLVYLGLAATLVVGELWGTFPELPEWVWLSGFNKSWVGFFRLAHVLSLAYVVVFSPIPAYLQRRLGHDNWIVSLGRNTLPVFWLSTLLAVLGHILRENVFLLPNDPTFTAAGFVADTALIGTGIALLFGLAFLLDWTRPGTEQKAEAAHKKPSDAPSHAAAGTMQPAE